VTISRLTCAESDRPTPRTAGDAQGCSERHQDRQKRSRPGVSDGGANQHEDAAAQGAAHAECDSLSEPECPPQACRLAAQTARKVEIHLVPD
jgi:hypothetical protein